MNTLFTSVKRYTSIRNLGRDERGLSTVEYVIILVLIAVAAIGTWSKFGDTIKGKIKNADDQVTNMGSNNNAH